MEHRRPVAAPGSSRPGGKRCQKLELSRSQTVAVATGWNNMKNSAGNIERKTEMSRLYAYFPRRAARSTHSSSPPRRPDLRSNYYICHGTDQRRRPNWKNVTQQRSRNGEYGDLGKERQEPESESLDNAHQDERDGKPVHATTALQWQVVFVSFRVDQDKRTWTETLEYHIRELSLAASRMKSKQSMP